MTKVTCPHCLSNTITFIGGVITAPEGVEYTKTFQATDVPMEQCTLSRELLRCDACGRTWNRDQVNKASELPARAIYWEMNSRGMRVPVICPSCGNNRSFIRVTLSAIEERQFINIDPTASELIEIAGRSADPITHTELILKYICVEPECDGEIRITRDEHNLMPVS